MLQGSWAGLLVIWITIQSNIDEPTSALSLNKKYIE